VRFRVSGRDIVFDDGGMNLLSSDALRELRDTIAPLAKSDQPLLAFRFARSAGADMNEMIGFTAEEAMRFSRDGPHDANSTIEMRTMESVLVIARRD